MAEAGKYYKLKDNYYWCQQLGARIKFENAPIVKAAILSQSMITDKGRPMFGTIISDFFGNTSESKSEIIFYEDDIACEYDEKPKIVVIDYLSKLT